MSEEKKTRIEPNELEAVVGGTAIDANTGMATGKRQHEPVLAATAASLPGEAESVVTTLDELEAITRTQVAGVMAGRHIGWRFDVTSGDPGAELIKAAIEHRAGAIVVGGRNHGVVGGLVVGSVAQKLVRKSPVSVLVVRHGRAQRFSDADEYAAALLAG